MDKCLTGRVAVIVPVFNRLKYIPRLVQQLLDIDYPDLAVIFVDDASTDGSDGALRTACIGRAGWEVVSHEVNRGPGVARQSGLDRADADYIWFADSDDNWRPDVLIKSVTVANSMSADIVQFGHSSFRGEAQVWALDTDPKNSDVTIAEDPFIAVLYGEITGHVWNKLFRVDLAKAVRFPSARTQEDFRYVVGAVRAARSIVIMPTVLYRRQLHEDSLISTVQDQRDTLGLAVMETRAVAETTSAASEGAWLFFCTWFYFIPVARSGFAVRSRVWPRRREDAHVLSIHLGHFLSSARRSRRIGLQALAAIILNGRYGRTETLIKRGMQAGSRGRKPPEG